MHAAMNLFGRRRKESSQPSSSSSTSSPAKGSSGVNPISILSATLPKSYRQQQSGSTSSSTTTTPKKGQKNGNDAALPPTPTTIISPDKENHANVKPRAHHATAPASAAGGRHHYPSGTSSTHGHDATMHINEVGQMVYSNQAQNGQPAFMVNGTGAGQQHHHPHDHAATLPSQQGKHSLPPIPRDPSSSKDLNMKALPNLKIANRRMSTGSIPSIDAMLASNKAAADTAELQVS